MSFLDLRGKAYLSKQDCELFPHTVDISNQEQSGRTFCVRPLALLALSKFRSLSRWCLAPSVLKCSVKAVLNRTLASPRAPVSFYNLSVYV